MFVQTEPTPNPATLKFLPGKTVMKEGTIFFQNQESADSSPLAMNLFAVKGVESVFFGQDFITITKAEKSDWSLMKPAILGSIIEHFTTNKPILKDNSNSKISEHTKSENDSDIVIKIKELLDTKVRPAVAMDGGDILFDKYDKGIVFLHMQGSCAGCPSSTATLKMGIENMFKHYIPEVREVRPVEA
jgi:Fe-S cluster biogenesis protein NfuA